MFTLGGRKILFNIVSWHLDVFLLTTVCGLKEQNFDTEELEGTKLWQWRTWRNKTLTLKNLHTHLPPNVPWPPPRQACLPSCTWKWNKSIQTLNKLYFSFIRVVCLLSRISSPDVSYLALSLPFLHSNKVWWDIHTLHKVLQRIS